MTMPIGPNKYPRPIIRVSDLLYAYGAAIIHCIGFAINIKSKSIGFPFGVECAAFYGKRSERHPLPYMFAVTGRDALERNAVASH